MKVGDVVGARRWPYEAAHPEVWGQPLRGEILSCNDRKAWEGSMLFATPSQQEVDAHVRWCREHGLLEDVVPVVQIPFFMIKQSNDMISLIDGHDQRF